MWPKAWFLKTEFVTNTQDLEDSAQSFLSGFPRKERGSPDGSEPECGCAAGAFPSHTRYPCDSCHAMSPWRAHASRLPTSPRAPTCSPRIPVCDPSIRPTSPRNRRRRATTRVTGRFIDLHLLTDAAGGRRRWPWFQQGGSPCERASRQRTSPEDTFTLRPDATLPDSCCECRSD